MRANTRSGTISFEALLFGLMVGAIATTAMTLLGGVAFLVSALAGGALAIAVWFVVVKLGSDLPPPRGQGNIDTGPVEFTPVVPAPKKDMPSPVVASPASKPAAVSAGATDSAPTAPTGTKPATLDAPGEGGAQDLKKIKGVGPKLEQLLHSMGYFHYEQIANWTEAEVAWVDENLEGFRGRVSRDEWVAQAKALAAS